MDQRVCKCVKLTGDSFLLAKLSLGDTVALETKYHTKYLLACEVRLSVMLNSLQDYVSAVRHVMEIWKIFFSMKIKHVPPSLSVAGGVHQGTKSDMLVYMSG